MNFFMLICEYNQNQLTLVIYVLNYIVIINAYEKIKNRYSKKRKII